MFQEYKTDRKPVGAPLEFLARRATVADRKPLAEISVERHGGDLDSRIESVRKQLADAAERQDLLFLVAEVAGQVVAFARAAYHRWNQPEDQGVPEGWYLLGIIVRPAFRERGIGRELTRARLAWIAGKADEAFFFANARNRVSIALHAGLGFEEITREFSYPGSSFEGGEGILFRLPTLRAFRGDC